MRREKMAEITVETKAYVKLLLHAAKYPHCAVNGILLAEDSKHSKDKSRVRFVDCIPLFHLSLSLAPMLEAALLQVTRVLVNSVINAVVAQYV